MALGGGLGAQLQTWEVLPTQVETLYWPPSMWSLKLGRKDRTGSTNAGAISLRRLFIALKLDREWTEKGTMDWAGVGCPSLKRWTRWRGSSTETEMEPVRGVWVPGAEWEDISYSRREWWMVSADASGLLKREMRTSRVVQWLRLQTPNAGGFRFNPWSGN